MPGFHRYTADRRTTEYMYRRLGSPDCNHSPSPGATGVAEVDDPSGSVVEILKADPEGPVDSRARTVAHPGKDQGDSDPGYCSHHAAVFGSPKPEPTQSSAGGCNRASPSGGDVFPHRG